MGPLLFTIYIKKIKKPTLFIINSYHKKIDKCKKTITTISRYACDVCHSLFSRRYYWKKHLQKQHGIEVPKPRPGRKKTNYVIGQELLAEKIDIATHSNEMATENVA